MVNFYLENRTNKKGEAAIRVSIAIRGARLVTSTGYNIKPVDWNAERHEVKPRKENLKKTTTYDINTALGNIKRHFDTYERDHGEVIEEELRKEFKTFIGRIEIKEETPAATEEPKEPTFFERFDQFIKEESINNMWVPVTKRALNVIKGYIEAWDPETSFDMLSESVLSQYINYHRTDLDQREVTVEKQWRYFKWFLDWDELMLLYKYKVPATGTKVKLKTNDGVEYERTIGLSAALGRVRDMFCFCCFTSLRYSDMRNLKRSDIVDGVINHTTVKTHDKIAIELNDYSKVILDKYEGIVFPGHSDYAAMKPYIDIAQSEKSKAMEKFNER